MNNAGVHRSIQGADVDAFREVYETNVFGAFGLTETLLPLLHKSPAGRVVNQSSIIGSLGTAAENEQIATWGGPAYASSKAALNMLTVNLAQRLKNTNIKVNSAHPGWVKTDMGGEGAPLGVVEGAKTAVDLALAPEHGPTGGFFHLGDRLPW